MFKKLLVTCLCVFFISNVLAIEAPDSTTLDSASFYSSLSEDDLAYYTWVDSVNSVMRYRTGVINLSSGLAELNVPKGYKYVNPKQASWLLSDVWGNPPQECLGIILPEENDPFDSDSYAIVLYYSEEGYVEDEDAKDLDYDDLLKEMKQDIEDANAYRLEDGYPPVHLLNWASKPYYDAETKKLHWAKTLQFGEELTDTVLNYDIRILGRKGYLELSFIGDLTVLPAVKRDMNSILSSVNFQSGNRYADFNPDIDKVAAYGIGGLIAGKVLAKVGFFALLLKFWKIIAIAVVAGFAAVKKFFGFKKKKDDETTPQAPSTNA